MVWIAIDHHEINPHHCLGELPTSASETGARIQIIPLLQSAFHAFNILFTLYLKWWADQRLRVLYLLYIYS